MDIAPKALEGAFPHFTVSVLPYDRDTGKVAMLYRGENVRSAKNCLAIPSGLLEHGESFSDGIKRELAEELGLPAKAMEEPVFRTIYRNQPGDGYDWVIGIWTIQVHGLAELAINKEPLKHDFMRIISSSEFVALVFDKGTSSLAKLNWAGGLQDALQKIVFSWTF